MPFTTLGLGPKIAKAVESSGYTEPTPIQTKAIPVILQGRDIIGVAQTGTGKTAAFVLPMLEKLSKGERRRSMRALVVAPTRELVVQIEENVRNYARNLNLRFATVYGGVNERPQISALRNGVDLVVATPGRLIDLMGQGHVNFSGIEFVVLDEADRMLDMGFLPQIRQIVRALPAKRQSLLFSATLSKEIEQVTKEFLKDPEIVQIGRRATPAETVTQYVYEVQKPAKVDVLIHLLQDKAMDMVLVFSRTKHGADKISRKLIAAKIPSATLHSNRTQNQRIEALKRFKSGEVRVLVATDIAARGIDVDGISHVVNFDFPPQPEDYVHRIGRTGRAHAVGDAISFVSPEEAADLKGLERFLGRGIPRKQVRGAVERHYDMPAGAMGARKSSPVAPHGRPSSRPHIDRPGSPSRPQPGTAASSGSAGARRFAGPRKRNRV